MKKYKILFEQESLDRLEQFIEYLKFSIFKRFTDSGLHGIEIILENYDEDLWFLEKNIFDEFERLGKMGIIGTIYRESWNIRKTRLIFPIQSYTVTAWCIADTEAETLTVESISINT